MKKDLDLRQALQESLCDTKDAEDGLDGHEEEAGDDGVDVGAGHVHEANLSEHRGQERRQDHDEDAVEDAADDGAATTVDGVTEDTSSAASEEVGHNAGDDEGAHEAGDSHADQRAKRGEHKAEDNGVRGIGEQDRAVQSGARIGDELHRDALEGGDELGEQQADAGEQDVQTNDELHGLEESVDHEVGGAAVVSSSSGTSESSDDQVENDHDQADGSVGILEEGQGLRNLEILGGLGLLAASELLGDACDKSGEHIAKGAEVTQGNVIGLGDLADNGLSEGRHEGSEGTTDDGADDDQGDTAQAAEEGEHDAERGLPQKGLASQEHILKLGETSEDDVHHEDASEADGDLGTKAEVGHCLTVNALDGSDDSGHAVEAEGGVEHIAKVGKRPLHDARAGSQNKEAKHRLKRAEQHVVGRLLLKHKAQAGDETDNNGGLRQDVIDSDSLGNG